MWIKRVRVHCLQDRNRREGNLRSNTSKTVVHAAQRLNADVVECMLVDLIVWTNEVKGKVRTGRGHDPAPCANIHAPVPSAHTPVCLPPCHPRTHSLRPPPFCPLSACPCPLPLSFLPPTPFSAQCNAAPHHSRPLHPPLVHSAALPVGPSHALHLKSYKIKSPLFRAKCCTTRMRCICMHA